MLTNFQKCWNVVSSDLRIDDSLAGRNDDSSTARSMSFYPLLEISEDRQRVECGGSGGGGGGSSSGSSGSGIYLNGNIQAGGGTETGEQEEDENHFWHFASCLCL